VFDTFLEAFYNKVFVNILVKRSSTDVYIEIRSKKGVIDHFSESFNTTILSSQLLEFINFYTKESPYFYISFLDISPEQGALPTCEKNRLGFYGDVSASEYKCHDNKWTYYTAKTDLYAMEKRYAKIGVDFVFSPYSVLSNFFKDKISTTLAMYLLVQDSFISLSVFDNGTLLYAEQLDMETISEDADEILASMDDEEEISLDIEQSINLEDIMQDLADFGDIEVTTAEPHETSFNEDYQRFSLIQTSLSHFYNNEKYDSTFVEAVYIADAVGVSSDFKHYLEEEMFLNVYLRRMDIAMEVCELAKEELSL